MHRTIAISTVAVATVFGLSAAGFAQAEPMNPSPAQLLGVQERSIQRDFKSNRTVNSVESSQPARVSNSVGDGTVLYRIDRNTRVVIGPAGGTTAPNDVLSSQNQLGDNRLQLLHDLEE